MKIDGIDTAFWEDMPAAELVEHVYANYPAGGHEGAYVQKLPPVGLGFDTYVAGVFGALGFKVVNYRWWISILKPDARLNSQDTKWVNGFPHEHGWKHGKTLVHYVQTAEEGGELVVFPEQGEPITVTPEPGLSVIVGGTLRHGVTALGGSRDRIVLIATGYGPEEE